MDFRSEIFSLNQNEAVGFVGKATNELLSSTAPRLEHLNKQTEKNKRLFVHIKGENRQQITSPRRRREKKQSEMQCFLSS